MGGLEVLCGPMFSGKTDELIARVRESGRAIVFKPSVDTRHPSDRVVSHSGAAVEAVSVTGSAELLEAVADVDLVAIDEVQFFDAGLVEAVEVLRARGTNVVAAGLDLDFRREPFPTTRRLADAAERVERLEAHCGRCGRPARVTQRLLNGRPAPLDDPVVRIGDEELYEPRCEECWAEERLEVPSQAASSS
jgi:thymidine kinase